MAFPFPPSLRGGVTPPTLDAWQFQYNGLTFGAGTSFGILSVKGLAMADVRHQDSVLPRDSGYLPGLDVYGGRTVELDLWMTGIGGLQSNQVALAEAFPLGFATESPLWFQLPNMPLLCVMARTRKRTIRWDAVFAAQAVAKPMLQLYCTDPRIYGVSVVQTVGLGAVSGGGLTFPVGPFPVTFGATAPASLTVTNSGTDESRPVILFTGPLTAPYLQNSTITSGPLVQVINPSSGGFTILDGDQLMVDMNVPHRVLYFSGGLAGGQAGSSVRSWLTAPSVWWDLPAATSSVLVFGSQDSSQTSGSVSVVSAPAYQL